MAIKENDINCYRKCKQTQIDFTINIWLGMLRHKQGCYLPFQAWPEANSSWHSWLTSTNRLIRQKNWHLGNDLSSIHTVHIKANSIVIYIYFPFYFWFQEYDIIFKAHQHFTASLQQRKRWANNNLTAHHELIRLLLRYYRDALFRIGKSKCYTIIPWYCIQWLLCLITNFHQHAG